MMRHRSFLLVALLLAAGLAWGDESRPFEIAKKNDVMTPEGVHGWMAYLRILAQEGARKGECSPDLRVMERARIPRYFSKEIPEVRSALERYRDDEEPLVRMMARISLAETLADAEDLLQVGEGGKCLESYIPSAEWRILRLIQIHGRKAEKKLDRRLFAATKAGTDPAAERRLEAELVWGTFAQVDALQGCIGYKKLLVDRDGKWGSPWEEGTPAP